MCVCISTFLSCCILSDIGFVLTYFRFPKDPCKQKIWLTALGINWKPPKTATVCSHHFTENNFENWTTKRMLKEAAVPTSAESIHVSDTNPVSETATENSEEFEVAVCSSPIPTPTYSEVSCSEFFVKINLTQTVLLHVLLQTIILHLVLCIMYKLYIFHTNFYFYFLGCDNQ